MMSAHLLCVPTCSTTPDTPGTVSALRIAERVFKLLTTGPDPLALDGRQVGHGFPQRPIPLDELRATLLHPSTGQDARDSVWRLLVSRTRTDGPEWKVGAVGVALPGLRAISSRLYRSTGHADTQAELLAAFLNALHTIDLDKGRIAARLCNTAHGAARKAVRTEDAIRARRVDARTVALSLAPFGHPDLVLARAVAAGIISPREARVIGATRLEKIRMADYATRIGSSYPAVRRCRARGEARLVNALREGVLADSTAEAVHEATHTYHLDLDHSTE